MWIIILGIIGVALVGIWACCVVASDADDTLEKYENDTVNRV